MTPKLEKTWIDLHKSFSGIDYYTGIWRGKNFIKFEKDITDTGMSHDGNNNIDFRAVSTRIYDENRPYRFTLKHELYTNTNKTIFSITFGNIWAVSEDGKNWLINRLEIENLDYKTSDTIINKYMDKVSAVTINTTNPYDVIRKMMPFIQ